MSFYLQAVILGLGFSALALGMYISMRIFHIPDITADGSYTLGAVVTSVWLLDGHSPLPTLFLSFLAGALAGCITGFIHTRLRVNALLAGILVMSALYSVNLVLMGRSNLPLIEVNGIFSLVSFTENDVSAQGFLLLLISAALWFLLSWLLKTDFGLAMRATGHNELMIRSLGVNTHAMKIIGLGLANGLVALSGCLIAQSQGYADIGMGTGIVIAGLGSVMIGEALLYSMRVQCISLRLLGVIGGSIVFRLILAVTLAAGLDPNLLKLLMAFIVLAVVAIPNLKKQHA